MNVGRKIIIPWKSKHDPANFRVARTWLLRSRLGEDLKELVERTTAFKVSREKWLLLC